MGSTDANNQEEPYDINFCFPIRELENERVIVTPFIPSLHGDEFWEGTRAHPELYTYLPFGPFPTLAATLAYMEERFHRDPALTIFAILDKPTTASSTGPPPLSGLCGFLNADPHNLSIEVGLLICLPAFQRRGLTHAAIALLLQYCLQLPRDGGLGLRRVQWQAHARNERSIGLARKVGFRLEGVIRWQRVLRGDKEGNGIRERGGDGLSGMKGRDSAVLSVCWDDWEQEVRSRTCVPEYTIM